MIEKEQKKKNSFARKLDDFFSKLSEIEPINSPGFILKSLKDSLNSFCLKLKGSLGNKSKIKSDISKNCVQKKLSSKFFCIESTIRKNLTFKNHGKSLFNSNLKKKNHASEK